MQLISTTQRQMAPVMDALLADTGLRETITYKKYVSQSFDSTAGHNVTTTSDTSITAIVVAHTKESMQKLPADTEVQVGDRAYIFKSDDCPSGMSLKDSITDSDSISHTLKDITPVYGIVTIVTVEGSR